jgi:PBP1b-binding outer membrane lipoprotein LpoB
MRKLALLFVVALLIAGCTSQTTDGDVQTVENEEQAQQAQEDVTGDVAEIQNSISDIEDILG